MLTKRKQPMVLIPKEMEGSNEGILQPLNNSQVFLFV